MVDLLDEKVTNSSKRKRVEMAGKGGDWPIDAIPLRSGEDLFQLPNVWSEPDCYGPTTTKDCCD